MKLTIALMVISLTARSQSHCDSKFLPAVSVSASVNRNGEIGTSAEAGILGYVSALSVMVGYSSIRLKDVMVEDKEGEMVHMRSRNTTAYVRMMLRTFRGEQSGVSGLVTVSPHFGQSPYIVAGYRLMYCTDDFIGISVEPGYLMSNKNSYLTLQASVTIAIMPR